MAELLVNRMLDGDCIQIQTHRRATRIVKRLSGFAATRNHPPDLIYLSIHVDDAKRQRWSLWHSPMRPARRFQFSIVNWVIFHSRRYELTKTSTVTNHRRLQWLKYNNDAGGCFFFFRAAKPEAKWSVHIAKGWMASSSHSSVIIENMFSLFLQSRPQIAICEWSCVFCSSLEKMKGAHRWTKRSAAECNGNPTLCAHRTYISSWTCKTLVDSSFKTKFRILLFALH